MYAATKNRPQYHLRGPMALFRCSSYCKHAPPTVKTALPTVNSAVTEGGAVFTVGGAPQQGRGTP